MQFVALVTLLVVAQYTVFTALCGKARARSGIQAPAVTGDETFERAYRVQMNTLEQMMIALPAMWVCAMYFNPLVAAALGLGFFLGRLIYRYAYMKDPGTRAAGMIIGFLCSVLMLLTALWGVVTQL